PFQTVATQHDDPAPIHRTRQPGAGSRKLPAKGELRRICKSCDASGGKPIGKAEVCRTEGTEVKPEPSIDSGEQQEKEQDKRQCLKEEFARRPNRRPDRAR